MGDIDRIVRDYRRALLERERRVVVEMLGHYRQVEAAINRQLDPILATIAAARAAGGPVSPSLLLREGRLRALLDDVDRQIVRFSIAAAQSLQGGMADAVTMGAETAEVLTTAAFGPPPAGFRIGWNRVPTVALEQLAAAASDGSPLAALFAALGPGVAGGIRSALIRGLALGRSPRDVARAVSQVSGMGLTRSLLISRTEMLRATRSAADLAYARNADVLSGKMWWCALDPRSCPSCIAMHGTILPIDTIIDDHPGGRCTAVPVPKSWAELGVHGVPDQPLPAQSGEAWFSAQDGATQLRILGQAKLDAYQQGRIGLIDLVRQTSSARWGTMRSKASLVQALASAQARGLTPLVGADDGLARLEAEIVGMEHETLIVLSQDGRLLLRKTGSRSEVDLSGADEALMRDAIATHNHPSWLADAGNGIFDEANAFSTIDIETAIRTNVAEMRVVTGPYVFRLIRPTDGWPRWQGLDVAGAFQLWDTRVRTTLQRMIWSGEITPERASAMHYHRVWSAVAEQLGIDYRRVARHEAKEAAS